MKTILSLFVVLIFVAGCGGSDSETMQQMEEMMEEMQEEEEMEEETPEEEEMVEEPEEEVPEMDSFCENHPSRNSRLNDNPQFRFYISENLNTEERQSFNVCFESGTPGAPFEDEPGILRNTICNPGDFCVFGCFSQELTASSPSESVKRQSQITKEDENENRYTRCREQSSAGTWEPWTDWFLLVDN